MAVPAPATAIAGLLKGTVEESLKAFVQPAGLVPAVVFVVVNLVVFYPTATGLGWAPIDQFEALETEWKVLTIGVLTLALGYIFLNLANSVLGVLRGDPLSGSLIGWFLLRLQKWRWKRLLKIMSKAPPAEKMDRRWELATQFPAAIPERPEPEQFIQPTRLGNAAVATQHVLYQRWGIDITGLWPRIEALTKLKDDPSLARVNDQKSTLDLLANLVFVFVAVTIEGLILFALAEHWESALLVLLFLPLAYAMYVLAVNATRAWGDSIEVVFDLHRGELATALGVPETKDVQAARGRWQAASRFFLPDVLSEDVGAYPTDTTARSAVEADRAGLEHDVFGTPPPPPVDVSTGPGVVAKALESEPEDVVKPAGTAPDGSRRFILRSIDQEIIVGRRAAASGVRPVSVVVQDTRMGDLSEAPDSLRGLLPAVLTEGGIVARVVALSGGPPGRLAFQVDGLRPGSSVVLRYTIPLWVLLVSGVTHDPVLESPVGYRIQGGTGTATLYRLAGGGRGTIAREDRDVGESVDLTAIPGRVWVTLPAGDTDA